MLRGRRSSDAGYVALDTSSANTVTAGPVFPTYPARVLSDSPLFYHRLDEASGSTTAADSSGHALPGVYGTSVSPAKLLLPFDDANGATADDMASVSPSNDATWVHLAGVFDASAATITLYANGAADGSVPHTSVWNGQASGLQVGRQREWSSWQNPWAGKIDDARVWPRALSASEMARVYSGSMCGTTVFGSTSLSAGGALQGAQQGQQASTSEVFSGSKANGYNPTLYTNPTTFSLECWFRSVRGGGRLISFGDTANGDSTAYDRVLWVNAGGNVVFGGASGTTNLAQSSGTYLDVAWHHVVVTVGPTYKIVLYVDAATVATQATYPLGNYSGMWRWGGEASNATWPGPTYLIGQIDEVAVYGTELSAQQVSWHYNANH